jgi:cysteine-rich repeat protein
MGGAGMGGAGTGGAGMGGAGMGGGVTCNNNGLLDLPTEECDPGPSSDPRCVSCVIDCGPNSIKDVALRRCYEIFPGDSDRKKWLDAAKACAALPGYCYLAVPGSDAEMALLVAAAAQYPQDFWLGALRSASAVQTESAFNWITLEPFRFGPTASWADGNKSSGGPKSPPWGGGQPDDSGGKEDCVEFAAGFGPGINDRNCDDSLNYLCECEAPGKHCNHDGFLDGDEECDDGNAADGDGCDHLCQVECPAPPGSVATYKDPQNHHCYSLFNDNKSWADSLAACTALGAGYHAARLRSVEDFDFVTQIFSLSNITWVDGTDQNSEGVFSFSDADHTLVPFSNGEFPWRLGEPNNSGGKENCIEILRFGGNSPGLYLNDAVCSDARPYLCERDAIHLK